MQPFTSEFAVAFRELMGQSLAQEVPATARVLAAIPDSRRDYRPHPASRSVWELAWHIAADVWFLRGIVSGRFEPNPDLSHPVPADTAAGLAEWYEKEFSAGLAEVRAMSADQLVAEIALGGVTMKQQLRFPAVLYLLFLEKHTIHHRGQLSACLRPMGARVPRIYGPSADEPS